MVWDVPSFTTKANGETIHAAHVNTVQQAIVDSYRLRAAPSFPWTAGQFHGFTSGFAGSTSSGVRTVNTLYLTPLWVPAAATIDQLLLNVTSGGGTNGRMGIYAANAITFDPDALLLDAGTIATGTGGVKTIDLAPLALDAQTLYWLASVFDGSPTVTTNTANVALLGTTNTGATRNFGYSAGHTFGALPNPPGALTAISNPSAVTVRVA